MISMQENVNECSRKYVLFPQTVGRLSHSFVTTGSSGVALLGW